MRRPKYVRPLTDAERDRLEAGLRSSDAFVLRRCQILLASSKHKRPSEIADSVGCDDQTVREVIRCFEERGIAACLTRGSHRPLHPRIKIPSAATEQLRDMLHQSPRLFDQPTSVWTLELAAEVSFRQGILTEPVTGEAIRLALRRLAVRWRRAKNWITSPDPEYLRKKGPATV
jgi:hypothetical protein